jgi:hypothetical protein
MKMKNEYEIRGDVTAIIMNSPKYGRVETLISTSQLERAQQFGVRWHPFAIKGTQSFYAECNSPMVNGKRSKKIRLHRWITNAPDGMVVDHRNHDTLDNTDSNLRVCTQLENQQNRQGPTRSGKSGIRGVTWHKYRNKWQAAIRINNISIHVGSFADIRDAEEAVKKARADMMPYSLEAI